MPENFIGFYWTRPVNWAGFRKLARDVDQAAKESRTIRYQRERVRRYIAEHADKLAGEIVFMDICTDRATSDVEDALTHAKAACDSHRARLIHVEFTLGSQWRRHPYFHDICDSLGIRRFEIDPSPVVIDGQMFDPVKHFERWRDRDEGMKAFFRGRAFQALTASLKQIPEGKGRYKLIADKLNGDGVKTVRGGAWTVEGVRKVLTRNRDVF